MKFLLFFLLPLASVAAIPNEFASVIDMARHVSGEFGADALIRIAATGKLDKATRIQLLEEAFQRAAEAQQPLKRRVALLKAASASGFFQRAYQQNLDGLSLRLRAVEAMLALDPPKARGLFLEIPPLQLPKVTCAGYLVYDVSLYYDVLGHVARRSFTPKEVAEGEPVRLLARFAAGVDAASEIEPAARMLAASTVGNADFQALITAFGGAVSQIYGDDRSFTAAVSDANRKILALADDARKRQVPPTGLIEGYRRFLVNNLAGDRCADDDLMGNGEGFVLGAGNGTEELGSAARFFNEKLAAPPVPPLREEDVTPSKIAGAASGVRACQEAECQQLESQYRSLMFDAQGAPLSAQQKDSAEWRGNLQHFLTAAADWKETTGPAGADQFREECALFGALAGAIPPGPDRGRVLLAWLNYLDASRMQQDDRITWFLPVNTMVGRVTLDPAGLSSLAEAMRATNDPVIALYVELERVAPRSPEQILSLL
jgi:hypothetical protein